MLKDSCKSIKSDDSSFIQKLNEYFSHHSDYIQNKTNMNSFSINHCYGRVKYNTNKFVSKSREVLTKNVFECLKKSRDTMVADLFTSLPSPDGSFSK